MEMASAAPFRFEAGIRRGEYGGWSATGNPGAGDDADDDAGQEESLKLCTFWPRENTRCITHLRRYSFFLHSVLYSAHAASNSCINSGFLDI
ncbi:hypothetical protein J2Z22_001849 [Paenibacillus forsythiae]|uniref:Uncharacterized protein n=1 Tax=Paenibacillus forsythiae TaxID=365616 RepID=A0ABU3H674_9BACL|nr:hypothetical protein [Paenibacillus forsythiae]